MSSAARLRDLKSGVSCVLVETADRCGGGSPSPRLALPLAPLSTVAMKWKRQ
jgi:hypothetical protein